MVSLVAEVQDLTHTGEGVVKYEGQVYFVPKALPGETIRFVPGKKRRGKYPGRLEEVLSLSPDRVTPVCRYFGVCGGCKLQHLNVKSQRQMKQKMLLDNLERIGGVQPRTILPLLHGEEWHYRRKARPGCKLVPAKGGILVGFREPGTSYLTSLRHCHTLDKRLSDLLDPCHELISRLHCPRQVPQLEFAAGDNAVAVVLRHLVPLDSSDENLLIRFAREHSLQCYVQPSGLDSIRPLWPSKPIPLQYTLPDFDVTLEFSPSDFIQVNGKVNEALIHQVVGLLEPESGDHILDLFCGLGNFTLPVARKGARVSGVEVQDGLVTKGIANARANGLDQVDFIQMDLFTSKTQPLQALGCRKWLLDPPRSGALALVENLKGLGMPDRIVYVSCNPATLARDASLLVHRHGYHLTHAGVIDMFPHTAHVESLAMFERSIP